MMTNLNMDCLRSFVAVVELGNFSKAAELAGRTSPAISLQMNRLEGQVGTALFKKQGRNQVLTPTGQEVLEHARAILTQNDAVLRITRSSQISGVVRMGVVQDIAESFFPTALTEFSDKFPNIRIQVLVDRSPILLDGLMRGELDQVIAYKQDTDATEIAISSPQMIWLEKSGSDISAKRPLPLVLVEGNCTFRTAALNALGQAGIPWEVTLTSPSLACVAAAAEAGLGVAVRTKEILNNRRPQLAQAKNLPTLPKHHMKIYNGANDSNLAIRKLTDFWLEQFAAS